MGPHRHPWECVGVFLTDPEGVTGQHAHWFLRFPSAISCGHPGVPANAVVTGEVFTFGAEVRYSCQGARSLVGNSTRVCQEDSHWSGALPHCAGV